MPDNEVTTIKVRKSTVDKLKQIAEARGRRESMEQIILELLDIKDKYRREIFAQENAKWRK